MLDLIPNVRIPLLNVLKTMINPGTVLRASQVSSHLCLEIGTIITLFPLPMRTSIHREGE